MRIFKTIVSTLFIFLMLFGIKLSFLPVGLSKFLLLFLLVYYVVDVYQKGKVIKIPRDVLFAIAMICVLIVYSVVITVWNGINDFQYASNLIYLLYEPILGGALVTYFFRNYLHYDINDALRAFSNAIFLQALLTVMAYVSPGINGLFNALLPNLGNIGSEQEKRVRGFTNLGGAWLSVIISIAVVMQLHFFGLIKSWKKRILFFLKILILAAATFVTGRTGLMLSILAIAIYCGYWLFIAKETKTFSRFFLLIMVVSGALYYYFSEFNSIFNQDTISWALEIFFSSNGSTASGDDLQSMLYLPKDFYSLMFGVGFYERGVMFYPRSDSGYVKTVLSIGLVGAALFYSMYIYYFHLMLKWINKLYGKRNRFLFAVLFLVFLIVEVKEPYLQGIGASTFIFFWFFFLQAAKYA